MKIYVTILEDSVDATIDAIRAVKHDHDGIEVRAERFAGRDMVPIRNATRKPLLLTHRGMSISPEIIVRGAEAGFDLIDVEWPPKYELPLRGKVVLSHHDYEAVPDVDALLRDMRATGCAHVKLAATPRSFAENEALLKPLSPIGPSRPVRPIRPIVPPNVTLIGMGDCGLYSRVLAPFLGSEFMFVAPNEAKTAAPGQLTLERALAIYGDRRTYNGPAIFAIVGNPVAHSLSPTIHNPLFREHNLNAIYTAAHLDRFDEILGTPRLKGISITAPFKEEAFRYAQSVDAEIGPNAVACGAVNTLLFGQDGVYADNTDVDGFRTILKDVCGKDRKSVAIVGAGGTARAALAAIEAMHVTVYNRTAGKLGARPLDELSSFDGEIVINTASKGADIPLPLKPGMTLIEAAYGQPATADAQRAGVTVYTGEDLLHAQAQRQNELFRRIAHDSR
ncbi:MAG TPA: type I 3-dehydroquinate dehydratase [Thermoanaerobaculia bacterium]